MNESDARKVQSILNSARCPIRGRTLLYGGWQFFNDGREPVKYDPDAPELEDVLKELTNER